MTEVAPRPRPAWEAQPSAWVTFLGAKPGAIRTDANGTQWWLDNAHQWRPVVHARRPRGLAQSWRRAGEHHTPGLA
jgi:hypothetical protein